MIEHHIHWTISGMLKTEDEEVLKKIKTGNKKPEEIVQESEERIHIDITHGIWKNNKEATDNE